MDLSIDDNENCTLCFHRSDSPGYSAKYTTYSFMDDWTQRIIQSNVVQVNVNTKVPVVLCEYVCFSFPSLLFKGVTRACGHCLHNRLLRPRPVPLWQWSL